MSAVSLEWRTVTPTSHPKHLVNGTELSVAFTARHRFAIYEIRCRSADGFPDRTYVVRDAEALGDADLKAGKRPPIVGRTDAYEAILRFVAKHAT